MVQTKQKLIIIALLLAGCGIVLILQNILPKPDKAQWQKEINAKIQLEAPSLKVTDFSFIPAKAVEHDQAWMQSLPESFVLSNRDYNHLGYQITLSSSIPLYVSKETKDPNSDQTVHILSLALPAGEILIQGMVAYQYTDQWHYLYHHEIEPLWLSMEARDKFVGHTVMKGSKAHQLLIAAQYDLGLKYYQGEGVSQDYKQAVKWLQQAAEQGYARSQNSLGFMYANGEGVSQDDKQAVKWYKAAALSKVMQKPKTISE